MDATLITNLYNFFIKANTDKKGVEASLILSSVAGAVGYILIESHLPELRSRSIKPGSNVFIESVSAELKAVYEELLEYAQAAGIDPDPNSGWIGNPHETDTLAAHILKFNYENFNSLSSIVEVGEKQMRSLKSGLLALCCMLIKQVGGTVIPEEEAKRIIVWSLQYGSQSMPF